MNKGLKKQALIFVLALFIFPVLLQGQEETKQASKKFITEKRSGQLQINHKMMGGALLAIYPFWNQNYTV